MKLLAVVTSPKKGGNTDTLVDDILQGVRSMAVDQEEKVEIDKVYFNPLQVRPCQDCGYCRDHKACSIDDDMTALYPLIEEADGLILASPVYFDHLSAQAKIFVDRCFPFTQMSRLEDGSIRFSSRIHKAKELIYVASQGSYKEAAFSCQESTIDYLASALNGRVFSRLYGMGTDFKPVSRQKSLRTQAGQLGKSFYKRLLEIRVEE